MFYRTLHGSRVGDEARQRWVFWIGSSLSFLTKVSLSAVLGVSRTQWVWLTLRTKWITMGGIDALFGVSSNPTFFANLNMLRRAKVATVMAIVMWINPLAAILTPGTISVETTTHINTVPCTVRSMVFLFERNPIAINLSNTGVGNNVQILSTGAWSDAPIPEYRTATLSTPPLRAYIRSAYTGIIAHPRDLGPDTLLTDTTLPQRCGNNCTYIVKFLAPSIKCNEFTTWRDVRWKTPVEFMRGTIFRTQLALGGILVGINKLNNRSRIPFIVLCRKSIVGYTVQQVILNRRFLEPVIVEAVHQYNLPVPQTTPQYPELTYLANENLFILVVKTLNGNITIGESIETNVVLTPIMDEIERDQSAVGTAIETMAQKMVVSLLSFEETSTDGFIYILDVAAVQETTCTTTESRVIYVYSAETLIVVYALAVANALVMVLAGFIALGQNGMASENTISTIIRTTRNPTLDRSMGGSCLGGKPMPKELEKLELRFGAVGADAGTSGTAATERTSHFALGIRGEITPITTGM